MFRFPTEESRLIVAVDPKIDPTRDPREQAFEYLVRICRELQGLGVTIKINTLARICGAEAVTYIHECGFRCFLDLKLFDIRDTIENDIAWISHYKPLILTIAERVHPDAIVTAKAMAPETLILPVGPLTDLTDAEFFLFGEESRECAVHAFFDRCADLEVDGTICSPVDLAYATKEFREKVAQITPGIKATGMNDSNSMNALTAEGALKAGAKGIVVGRAITGQHDIRAAALRYLDVIRSS